MGKLAVTLACLLAPITLTMVGCRSEILGNPAWVNVPEDHPDMVEAKRQAKSTIDEFISAFLNPEPSHHHWMVHCKLTEGNADQQVCLTVTDYSEGQFTGEINVHTMLPLNSELARGDSITVAKADITDWQYWDDEEHIGGFTIKAWAKHQPKIEKYYYHMPWE